LYGAFEFFPEIAPAKDSKCVMFTLGVAILIMVPARTYAILVGPANVNKHRR
jgi:hypothetical protein